MAKQYPIPGVYIQSAPVLLDKARVDEINRVIEATEQKIAASAPKPAVIYLTLGEKQPDGADFVQVVPVPSGGYQYSFTVAIRILSNGRTQPYTSGGSVNIEGLPFTADEAEAAGISAALSCGAKTLYVLVASGSALLQTQSGRLGASRKA